MMIELTCGFWLVRWPTLSWFSATAVEIIKLEPVLSQGLMLNPTDFSAINRRGFLI